MTKVQVPSAPTRRRNAISNAVRDRIVLDHLPLVNECSVNLRCAGVLQECGTLFVDNGLPAQPNIRGFRWVSAHRVYNWPSACTFACTRFGGGAAGGPALDSFVFAYRAPVQ
jgi:hypothetical protein